MTETKVCRSSRGAQMPSMPAFLHRARKSRWRMIGVMVDDEYQAYLRGPEWAAKKAARLDLDGHRCQGCQQEEHLQVHHVTYARRGRERISDLITVCDRCHRMIHKAYRPCSGAGLRYVTFKVLRQMKPREATGYTRTELPLVMPEKDKRGNYRS